MLAVLAVLSWEGVLYSLAYAAVGIVSFVAGFWVLRKVLPFDVNKELEADHNMAVGVVIAAFILGLAIIIASAVGS
jgi:putative membrane protein